MFFSWNPSAQNKNHQQFKLWLDAVILTITLPPVSH